MRCEYCKDFSCRLWLVSFFNSVFCRSEFFNGNEMLKHLREYFGEESFCNVKNGLHTCVYISLGIMSQGVSGYPDSQLHVIR